MAELTMTTFLSLDGVMQAPGGPGEDTSGNFPYGGWLVPHADTDMGKTMVGIFSQADAFLLGRTTCDIFAAYWPRIVDPAHPDAGENSFHQHGRHYQCLPARRRSEDRLVRARLGSRERMLYAKTDGI